MPVEVEVQKLQQNTECENVPAQITVTQAPPPATAMPGTSPGIIVLKAWSSPHLASVLRQKREHSLVVVAGVLGRHGMRASGNEYPLVARQAHFQLIDNSMKEFGSVLAVG